MCLLDFLCFRNSVEKLCVSWALSLVEYVAVGALKLPVPSTDVLKTHESQSFFLNYREPNRLASNTFLQTESLSYFSLSHNDKFTL